MYKKTAMNNFEEYHHQHIPLLTCIFLYLNVLKNYIKKKNELKVIFISY